MGSSLEKPAQGGSSSDGENADDGARRKGLGFRYEEVVIALIFLRCLRKRLDDFEVTSDSQYAGKFDDVVVRWRSKRATCSLLVQLKHKTSKEFDAIRYSDLFSHRRNRLDFNVWEYQESYSSIKRTLSGSQHSVMVSTNVSLHSDALNSVQKRTPRSVLGAELLDAGGYLYEISSQDLDPDFQKNFFMFCGQRGVDGLKNDIKRELGDLLGDGDIHSACNALLKCVMEWKDGGCTNPEILKSDWPKWKDIKNRYEYYDDIYYDDSSD